MFNLTESEKGLLRWLAQQTRDGKLAEEFQVSWARSGAVLFGYQSEDGIDVPEMARGTLDALAEDDLLRCRIKNKASVSKRGDVTETETCRWCKITQKGYDAVDSDFHAPDTSFVKHLTPLADVTNLDEQLKKRCLPILGAGAADPTVWDSAVRTAGVILEERLREVGGITDPNRVGQSLVNDLFTSQGTLAAKFQVDSERQGYRDLFAGVVGVFRNPSAHRLLDPSPETGGALIVFINLLLKKLEALH